MRMVTTAAAACLALACGDSTDPGSSAPRIDPVGIWDATISGLQGTDAGGQPATCRAAWIMAIEAIAIEPVRTSTRMPYNGSLQCGQDEPVNGIEPGHQFLGIEPGHQFLLLQSSDTLTFLSSFTARVFLAANFTDSLTLTGQVEDHLYPGATFSATRRSDTADPNRAPYDLYFYTEWGYLEVGDSMAAIPTVHDAYLDQIADPPVTMSSDRPDLATVDAAGMVQGIAPGRVHLTAVIDTLVQGDYVIVLPLAASMEITEAPDFIVLPDSGFMRAEARDAAGEVLPYRFYWTSSNPAVATVSEQGYFAFIAPVAPGTVTILARSTRAEASVTLDVLPAVAGSATR